MNIGDQLRALRRHSAAAAGSALSGYIVSADKERQEGKVVERTIIEHVAEMERRIHELEELIAGDHELIERREDRIRELEQLCPYCEARLGFESVDRWYVCPACRKWIHVEDCDGDIEDCHAFQLAAALKRGHSDPLEANYARRL